METYNNLIVERDGAVVIVTMNRPKALNALNHETVLELDEVFKSLEADTTVEAVIITGGGDKAFIAGADISEMVNIGAIAAKNWSKLGLAVFSRIENFPRPVIAAVNGFALGGGCELALACDIRVASEKAKFGLPEVSLGILPGWGATQRLSRLVGKGQAKLLTFTGDVIDAQEARNIGLVDKVVAHEELLTTAKDLAGKIVKKAPIAIMQAKVAINRGVEMDSEQAFAFLAELFGTCFSTEDQTEGMTAFIEKRKPVFKGQ